MKKIVSIVSLLLIFLTGCGSKNNEIAQSSSRQTIGSSKEEKSSSSLDKSESIISTDQKSETLTSSSMAGTESTTIENSTTYSEAMIESSEASSDPLSFYTDEQIEYARVWLTVQGTAYKNDLGHVGFTLNVNHSPAGTKINPYDKSSLLYPKESVTLTGKYGYQGLVVYSSNHDGSIMLYPVPSHFQQPDNQDMLKQEEQTILDHAQRISIPTGDPEGIQLLISTMNIFH